MIFGLRTVVINALEDWSEVFRNYSILEKDGKVDSCDGASTEIGRNIMIEELFQKRLVYTKDWCAEEICALITVTYPLHFLFKLTRDGKCSRVLDTVHKSWQPSFYEWAKFLWLYCQKASTLYGDVLYLLPASQKAKVNIIGKAIFSDLVHDNIIPQYSLGCIVSAFIKEISFSMSARTHENLIDQFGADLKPHELGLMCRSIVICRAMRKNRDCRCGYEPGEDGCKCPMEDPHGNLLGQSLDDYLTQDIDKEYCSVLFKLILERHSEDANILKKRWTPAMRDEFLQSACDYVFSEQIYTEIYQNLHSGAKPTVKQNNPRELSDKEKQSNAARFVDGDYDHSYSQHGGCVYLGCKQAMKADCLNVACKQHCHNFGRYMCKVHRNYDPKRDYEEPQRLNIREEGSKPRSINRGEPFVREGDI